MPKRLLRDWTDSKAVNSISEKAEVFFVRLIMVADDYGRFHADVKLLRHFLFPLRTIREADCRARLLQCEAAGLLRLYRDPQSEKELLQIKNFNQRIRPDSKSKFPPPPLLGNFPRPKTETETETETETKAQAQALGADGDGARAASRQPSPSADHADSSLPSKPPNGQPFLPWQDDLWESARQLANRSIQKLKLRCEDQRDRLLMLKTCLLIVTGKIPEDWLVDSIEAVRHTDNSKPWAYLTGCLKTKAEENGLHFLDLLKPIRVPEKFLTAKVAR